MSTLKPERIAHFMAVAVARGRLADLAAADHALAALRTEAKYAVGEDEPRLRTIADHIWPCSWPGPSMCSTTCRPSRPS